MLNFSRWICYIASEGYRNVCFQMYIEVLLFNDYLGQLFSCLFGLGDIFVLFHLCS